jgi:hypothetical protein
LLFFRETVEHTLFGNFLKNMKAIAVESRSFLKERTIKFCIVMAFISIWLLVLVIYYSKGQSTMSHLQTSLFQFLISTNLITLTLFLVAGLLQVISMKRKVTYRCNSIMTEVILLCFITCFQTVAAIALSAGTPSFPCTKDNTCREGVFFAIVAWIAPLLFTIHTIELLVRVRRAAVTDSSVWTTAAWTVDWEGTFSNFKDINAVEKGLGPKALVLPQAHSKVKRHTLRKSMPPPPPPKTPSSFEQCILIVPNKVQYVVPRLGPVPRYFIQIPDNIQYTVPRLTEAPCPKQRRKERRKARRAQGQSRKWSRYLKIED